MGSVNGALEGSTISWGVAEPPLHVVLVTGDESLQWSVLEGFAQRPRVRVTACSTMSQCWQECAVDPPDSVILDLALLDEEPQALVCLAGMVRPSTHVIALTGRPQGASAVRLSRSLLSFVRKPVEVADLVRLASRGPGPRGRPASVPAAAV